MVSLIDVRNLIKKERQITVSELLQRLDVQPAFLEVLLADLVARGKVARCQSTVACQSECQGCGDKPLEVSYRWIEFAIDIIEVH